MRQRGKKEYRSLSSSALHNKVTNGDYVGFLDQMEAWKPRSNAPSELQVLQLRILMQEGLREKVYEKAKELKEAVHDDYTRSSATLLFLYLDWLLHGRTVKQRFQVTRECERICEGQRDGRLMLFAREIKTALASDMVMLGLTDPSQKPDVVKDYKSLVSAYQLRQMHHEAFLCVLHLTKFLRARPYPMSDEALLCLERFSKEPYVNDKPFYQSSVDLQMAELCLEAHLSGAELDVSPFYFASAFKSFRRSADKSGSYKVLSAKGSILLEHGRPQGRDLLLRAIRGFEHCGDLVRARKAANQLLNWFQKTGASDGVKGCRLRVLDYAPAGNGLVKATTQNLLDDFALRTNQALVHAAWMWKSGNEHEAETLLKDFMPEAEAYGSTLSLARLNAALWQYTKGQTSSQAKQAYALAIHLFEALGYPQEALNLILEALIRSAKESEPTSSGDIDSMVNQQLTKAEALSAACPVLESQELLGRIYEVVADIHRRHQAFSEATAFLDKAEAVYQNFGLQPRLAFNRMFKAYFMLENATLCQAEECWRQLTDLFNEAHSLFRVLDYERGICLSELGIALVHGLNEPAFNSMSGGWNVENVLDLMRHRASQPWLTAIKAGLSPDSVCSGHPAQWVLSENLHKFISLLFTEN